MSEEVKAPRPPKRTPKKKVCVFCVEHIDYIDYKDAARLRRFITENIKRARVMALLPYKAD